MTSREKEEEEENNAAEEPKSSEKTGEKVDDEVEKAKEEPAKKKARLSKHTTMIATSKESETLLKNTKIDSDAKTRNQAKEINKLIEPKKPRLAKNRTIAETAKVKFLFLFLIF